MDRGGLAEASGLSYPYLSEIENGRKQPSTSALTAIAEALEMNPSELLASTEWSLGPKPDAFDVMPARMAMESGPPARSWFHEEERVPSQTLLAAFGDVRTALMTIVERLDAADVQILLQLAQRLASSESTR